jgi:hypothetical protein
MANLPVPTSVSVLQSFMGLLNYYRHFVPGFSATAKPLNHLLQKGVPFEWGPQQQRAFDTLKKQLCTEGLALRRPDPNRQFIVHSDWSQHGLGAVLAQLDDDGHEYMVACASRSLNVHERNYTPWKGELLAVVWAIKTFRVYLHGVHFELYTDHRPLLWLLNQQEPTGQHARWVLSLMEFDFHVRHRAGVEHVNADVLSRYPQQGAEDDSGAQLDHADDPVRAPLPQVVFGPVGTGTPTDLPAEQIPQEAPPLRQPPRQQGAHQGEASTSQHQPHTAVAGPNQPHNSRKKQTKRMFRKQHESPYAAVAADDPFDSFTDPIFAMALSVTAAQGKAAFVQRQLACHTAGPMDSYTFSGWEPWELPYTQISDPLAGVSTQPWAAERQQQLRQQATSWVASAAAVRTRDHLTATPTLAERDPASLDISSVAATFFPAAAAGLIVYEPFGGLCSGLEMVLRNGFQVHRYFYSDVDPTAQAVAQHRLLQLQARYPGQLPPTALEHTFTALPQDVWNVTPSHLQDLAQRYQRQWLVVGGWECQDLSPAGNSQGLTGKRSSTLAPLVQILATLQQCQLELPPAYIVENTAMQYNFRSEMVRGPQFQIICAALGEPTCLDATQFDSLAHRVRNYWTNLCTAQQLTAATEQVQRTPGLRVETVIDPSSGRYPMPVTHDDTAHGGRYPVNKVGEPRSAWPTFVAFPESRAFLPGEPGYMYCPAGGLEQPTADEREQAMGYIRGDTQAPGVTERQRREVLGRCIDANVLQSIMAIAAAWFRQQHWAAGQPEVTAAVPGSYAQHLEQQLGSAQTASAAFSQLPSGDTTASAVPGPALEQYLITLAVAAVAEAQEGTALDIWKDPDALYFLREQQYKPEWPLALRDRVRKRAAKYIYTAKGEVRRLFPDGSSKLVPKPEERTALITEFHQRTGHYGVRRTGALISNTYWWWGLWNDVSATLSKCGLCSRVRSSFNGAQPELQPLPISGLMYRWGVDLCGPFHPTARGNQYVMVAVEHYSKHLELIPIPNKEPATTAAAFASAVLGRYGSPAEVVTDRGGEWMKEFEQLLLDCMIDHRHTSASHPAANGLSERCVGTAKRALSKLCAEQGSQLDWDLKLPWVMLGYNASPQAATGLSPYQLMHAVTPIVPPAIKERLEQPVDFDNSDAAVADFLARARLVKDRCVMAGDNLRIAQHRDTLRYAKLRSGTYTPQLRRYLAGDYVWVKRKDKQGLDIAAKPLILRVAEVRPSGVLILQGRCGTQRAVHASQCAPCHLPNIDPRVDWSLGKPPQDALCERCGGDDSEQAGPLIFCDNCNGGWHLSCHQPQLPKQPRGTWVCQPCLDQGITLEAVKAMQRAADQRAVDQIQPEKCSPAELQANALDGRLLRKLFTKPGEGKQTQWYLGKVYFRGRRQGGNLLIAYEDGDAEITTLRKLQRQNIQWLPEGTAVPDGVHFRTASQAEADIANRTPAGPTCPATQVHQPPTGGIRNTSGNPSGQVQVTLRRSSRRAANSPAAAALHALHAQAFSSQPSGPVLEAAALSDALGVLPAGTPALITTDQLCLVHTVQQPCCLPPYWDLTNTAGVQAALQLLMPGPLAPKDATRISNSILRMMEASRLPEPVPGMGFVPMTTAEVLPLLESTDFSCCSSFYDPFAGSGTIAQAFASAGFKVTQNDLNPFWEQPTMADALQPGNYMLSPQVIVTSPPFEVLDLAVPILAAKATVVACVHVPGHWLSNPRAARQRWLQQLAVQQRLHIIMGLERGPSHRRCAWILVFSSAAKRAQLLKQGDFLTYCYAGA